MPIFDQPAIDRYAKPLVAYHEQAPSGPGSQPSYSIGKWPYIAMLGSDGADIASSIYGSKKGLHESNPLIFDTTSLVAGKLATSLLKVMLVNELVKSGHPKAAKISAYLSSVPPSIAAINNLRLAAAK